MKKNLKLFLSFGFILFLANANSAFGAAYIKYDGVEGETKLQVDTTVIGEEGIVPTPEIPAEINVRVFSDIAGYQYESAIKYVQEQGIVNGYLDNTFRPNDGIDRAQMTKIIMVAVYGENVSGENCFSDIKNEWFAPYVCSAKEKEIVTGMADGNFYPAKSVTFAESLKIALNAYGYGMNIPEAGGEWFEKYLAFAKRSGLSFTKQNPHETITRGEMAEIISWLSSFKDDKDEGMMDEEKMDEEVTEDDTTAVYQNYDAAVFAAHTGKKALFFHAEWCPTCRAMETDILENLTSFPAETFIAKANYDTETELKEKYGITTQSTVVFFDKNGEVIEKKLNPSSAEIKAFFSGHEEVASHLEVSEEEIPFDSFAKCIGLSGAIFYENSKCADCEKQKALLKTGQEFMISVDCDEQPNTCAEAGVAIYPTWKFTSGESRTGMQSMEELSVATNCKLPE